MTYYHTVSSYEQPPRLDNSSLLANRPIQTTVANCVIISVCNIIEAKYWQHTGNKIEFDYDGIYAQLATNNSGYQFSNIPILLKIISDNLIPVVSTFKCSKYDCRTAPTFIKLLRAALHKNQFATIGVNAIKHVCDANHAVTVCGYTTKSFLIQTTYATQKRFVKVDNIELFNNFVNFQCCDINRLIAN